jgi:hypothetical protein
MNLLWVIVVAAAAVSATPITIVDYDGGPAQGEAWIVLTLHGDSTQLLVLQHVTWCKSFVPNDQSPPELAPDCGGRNVMRLQLFPGAEEVVLKELPASSSTSSSSGEGDNIGLRFYIDPVRVGGWDTRHQWNIYLEMSQRNGVLYKESVRFNPIKAAPTTTTTTVVATTPPPPPPPSAPASMPTPPPPPIIGGEGLAGAEVVVVIHSWKGALIVLSVGSFLILSLVGLVKFLQTSEQRRLAPLNLANQRSQMQARVYGGGGSGTYSFERSDEIEMTDFSRDDADEEEEEDRLRKEDLQILEMIK